MTERHDPLRDLAIDEAYRRENEAKAEAHSRQNRHTEMIALRLAISDAACKLLRLGASPENLHEQIEDAIAVHDSETANGQRRRARDLRFGVRARRADRLRGAVPMDVGRLEADPATLQMVRDAAQSLTTSAAFVDRLRDTEPEAARGTPGSRRRELTNLARRLEAERGRLEQMYS